MISIFNQIGKTIMCDDYNIGQVVVIILFSARYERNGRSLIVEQETVLCL